MYGPKFNTRTQATYNAALSATAQRQGDRRLIDRPSRPR